MKKILTLTLGSILTSGLAGCGKTSDVIDNQVMESSIETANDSGDDAVVEQSGSLAKAFGLNGGNAGALSLGCVDVTTEPDPLPSPRPDHFVVTWTFDGCSWRGFTQSGTRTVEHTKNADGSRDLNGTRDLERIRRDGDHVAIDTTGTMHAVGDRASGTVNRTIEFQEHRLRTHEDGSLVFDADVSTSNLTEVSTFSADDEVTRVFNGDILSTGRKAGFEITSTLIDLTREPAVCCHPTAGTVKQVVKKNGELKRERTFTFSSDCGVVEREDGETVELPACS